MSIVWTQTNSTRNGKVVRQSFTATDANSNLLVRENMLSDEGPGVWNTPSYNEQPQGQSQLPGHDHTANYAEAMICIDASIGDSLAGWVLQSQILNGERTDQLWSNTISGGGGTGGTLYLSISTIKDTPPSYLTQAPGNLRIVAMSLAVSAAS